MLRPAVGSPRLVVALRCGGESKLGRPRAPGLAQLGSFQKHLFGNLKTILIIRQLNGGAGTMQTSDPGAVSSPHVLPITKNSGFPSAR